MLAAASCVYAAIQFERQPTDFREVLFWAGLSILLLVSLYYAGNTLFNSWLPGVPAEIQSALGTRYVDYRTAPVRNIPQILSSLLIVIFALTTAFAAWQNKEKKEEIKQDESRQA